MKPTYSVSLTLDDDSTGATVAHFYTQSQLDAAVQAEREKLTWVSERLRFILERPNRPEDVRWVIWLPNEKPRYYPTFDALLAAELPKEKT